MTFFWAALIGAASGAFIYAYTYPHPSAIWLGAGVTAAMASLVWLWRTYLKP